MEANALFAGTDGCTIPILDYSGFCGHLQEAQKSETTPRNYWDNGW